MSDNPVFTSLLAEIASQLGVEVAVSEGEALTFDFEDGMTGVISHLEDSRHLVLEAGIPWPASLSDRQSADLAWLLLRMNALLMSEQSMAIAAGTDGRITVIRVMPQQATNAVGMADSFESVVEKGRWLRSVLDQVVSRPSEASEADPQEPVSQTDIMKV